MITVKDIAEHTNLSVATVTQILGTRSHKFRRETRDRVQQAARELGYRPNPFSKALKNGRSMTIGVVVGGINSPMAMSKLVAIEDAARHEGYLTYLVNAGPRGEATARSIAKVVDQRIDGLILYFHPGRLNDLKQTLKIKNMPVVYIDGAPEGVQHWVQIDRAAAVRQVAQHLASLGHKTAAYISSDSDWNAPEFRLEPYQTYFAEAGIKLIVDERWRLNSAGGLHESAYRIAQQLARIPDRPTALMMNNDDGAMAAIAGLKQAGLRIPQDISVVGFDDIDLARYAEPSLTTIHHPRAEVGAAAFEMLFKLLSDEDADVTPVRFACELVVRDSTGPARQVSG